MSVLLETKINDPRMHVINFQLNIIEKIYVNSLKLNMKINIVYIVQ